MGTGDRFVGSFQKKIANRKLMGRIANGKIASNGKPADALFQFIQLFFEWRQVKRIGFLSVCGVPSFKDDNRILTQRFCQPGTLLLDQDAINSRLRHH